MSSSIKQRLVGAVVLITLVLILWPVVMSPQRERSFVVQSDIPDKPPLPPSRIEEPRPPSEAVPPPAEPARVGGGQAQVVSSDRVVPSLDKDGLPVAWIVQVGSFGSRDNAVKLQKSLQAEGYRASIKEQKTSKRTLSRVIVGPYVDKYMAQRDRNKIAADYDLQPEVMRFRP